MNRDFSLPATPGRARILLKLAAISKMTLDPKIEALAATGLSSVTHDFNTDEAAAIQTMLDYGMRCVVPGPMIRSFDLVVEAARLGGITTIVCLTQSKGWFQDRQNVTKANGIEMIIKQVNKPDVLDSDFIREHRHHLLVFDPNAYNSAAQGLFAHSFPKAIALTNDVGMGHVIPLASILFPKAPVELLDTNFMQRREFEVKGFKFSSPNDLAFLLNVVTDHLPKNAHENAVKAAIFNDGDDDIAF